jgi:hypothetical protein
MAGHAMVERCARTTGCRARRAHSRMCSRRRAGAALGPASLACEPREQDTVLARQAASHVRQAVKAGDGARANFGPVAPEFKKKILFYFSFFFKLNSNFKFFYLNIQSCKNYETSSVGFIIF